MREVYVHKSIVKLLLVDDVAANLLALEQLVEADDRELITASSGEEALEILLKEQKFAVILMDVQMPGLDGFDTVRLLKAKANCCDIPIVFLTAFDKEGAMETEAYSSGAVDYVMKPIQPQILIGKVDVFVELYRTRQNLELNNDKLERANLKLTHEISSRERAEAKLRLADQVINDTHEGVIIVDAEGVVQRVNSALCKISEFKMSDMLNQHISRFSLGESKAAADSMMIASLQKNGEWQGELCFKNKKNNTSAVWAHISGIHNKYKRITHYCAILSTVNNAKKSEMELRKIKLRLEQSQHVAHLGTWEWNCFSDQDEGEQLYISDELLDILHLDATQGTPDLNACMAMVHTDDKKKLEDIIGNLKQGKPSDHVLTLVLQDGEKRIVHEQTHVLCDRNGDIVQLIGTVHDITKQAKLEESFMQAQKMEAVGAMVGGIAHEFNNILAGLSGHIYLAKKKTQDHQQIESLSKMELLTSRAAETIEQMLTFSRKGVVDMKPVHINDLAKETLKLHRTSIPEDVDINANICTEDLSVQGDVTLLQQLMLNLMINARDALIGVAKPVIALSICKYNADERFLSKYTGALASSYAKLTVQDNGCGIPIELQNKIFEPFFTSKGNKGTGLGLSMVYGAVQSHNGMIEIESESGAGCAFHIYLPLLEDLIQENVDNAAESLVEGNGETILVVDDEEIVRQMVEDILMTLGYKVMTAKNGQEAVELFASKKHHIDIVILDMIMPKMGGKDAAAAITQLNPEVKIMFMTGYSDDLAVSTHSGLDRVVLSKPFDIHSFSQEVGKALKGAGHT